MTVLDRMSFAVLADFVDGWMGRPFGPWLVCFEKSGAGEADDEGYESGSGEHA
jgi:hypothetical protein